MTFVTGTITLTQADEEWIWERRILRKSPLKTQFGDWRIRTNYELEKLTDGTNIIRFIKAQRLRWLRHIMRIGPKRMVKS